MFLVLSSRFFVFSSTFDIYHHGLSHLRFAGRNPIGHH